MDNTTNTTPVVLVAGGGIGGLAAALALVRQGFRVTVLEQAPEIGEIGAGIQLGPNAFHAFDALGIGEKARGRAVYTDYMVMHDAVDAYQVGKIPTGEAFRERFGNPYAVIHRVDVHLSLLEGAQETGLVDFRTSTRVVRIEQDADGVTAYDQHGNAFRGVALIGADGVRSVARQQYVGDPARVTGHVVYRAVVDKQDFPKTCSGTRPASGSARTATSSITRCAAASSTTWSSPSTAASRRSGVCARAARRRCRATSRASARRRAS